MIRNRQWSRSVRKILITLRGSPKDQQVGLILIMSFKETVSTLDPDFY